MIAVDTPLVLSSASPRRRDILRSLGLPIVVHPTSVDENVEPAEAPEVYIERIVAEKLAAAAANVPARFADRFGAIVVADTIVVIDGQVLGKPADAAEAKLLLSRLAGRTHTVHTRYAVSGPSDPKRPLGARTVSTEVTMRSASESELERYAETGEGLDKAGAYAAQGIGCFLIESVHGSYTNVVGLPACELVEDLCRTGLLERFP